jgi:hypothetical protein
VPASGTITPTTEATRALVCVACQPGFAPTYAIYGTSPNEWVYISTCTAIANCDAASKGTVLNSCSTCPYGKVSGALKLDYGTCLQTTKVANCFASDTATNCWLCNPGYVLTKTSSGVNTCVLLAAANGCSKRELNYSMKTILSTDALGKLVLYNGDALIPFFTEEFIGGCSACSAGNTLVIGTIDDPKLPLESCLSNNPVVLEDQTAVTNCATFSFLKNSTSNIVLGCTACATGSVLTQTTGANNTCLLETTSGKPKLTNCVLYNGGTDLCLKCKDNYLLLGGACFLFGATELNTANCLAWDYPASATAGALKCLTCKSGFALASGACSAISNTVANCGAVTGTTCTACTHGYVLVTVNNALTCLALASTPLSYSSTFPHDSNCYSLAQTAFNSYNLECTECVADKFLTDGTASDYYCYPLTLLKPSTAVTNCVAYSTANLFASFVPTCTKCNDASAVFLGTNVCTARTAVANCADYTQNADTCAHCVAGYTLASNACTAVVAVTNTLWTDPAVDTYKVFDTATVPALASCATTIASCTVPLVRYDGLSAPWAYLFSCHKCDSTSIPFAFVKASVQGAGTYTGFTGLHSYSRTNSSSVELGWYDDGLAVECLDPAAAPSQFNAGYTGKYVFPANCALGIVNVWSAFDASHASTATNVDRAKIGVMCVACKPAFKAVGATDTTNAVVQGMVSSCTAIANCQTSATFNLCDACATGYLFQVDVSGLVDYTTCVATALTNCQLLTSATVCFLCANGYYKNLDGVCEQFTSPNCVAATSQFEASLTGLYILDALFVQPYKGCSTGCSAGWKAAQSATPTTICQTTALADSRPNGSKFVANCKNYLMAITATTNVVYCAVCKTGFTLTTGAMCITTTDSNCVLAVDASTCQTCVNGDYLLINNVCTLKNIANCAQYSTSITTRLTCLDCLDGYYLENNQCTAGAIPNCAHYVSAVTCDRCQTDFVVRTDVNGATTCVASPTPLNCYLLDQGLYNQYSFTCSSCGSMAFLAQTAINNDYCFQIGQVTNCEAYDIKTRVSDSTWKCTRCSSQFYLNLATNACVARTSASLVNCTVADPKSDTCLTPAPVASTPAASAPLPIADPQPTGIPSCMIYDANLVCVQCDSATYFNGTRCLPLTPSAVIGGCAAYNSTQNCTRCTDGYLLKAGVCVAVLGESCKTVNPVTTDCDSCYPGFGLFPKGQYNVCKQLNGTNCYTWAANYPYNCTSCLTGFALVNYTCVALNTTVANCLLHSADGVCSLCSSNFALNVSQESRNVTNSATNVTSAVLVNVTSCVATSTLSFAGFVDPNCDSLELTPAGSCYLCSAGFTLQNGQCVACKTAAGCLICDPVNSALCRLCQSGYHMNPAGTCDSDTPQPVTPNTTNSTNNTTPFTPSSASKLAWAVVLTLLSVLVHWGAN